MPFLSPLRVEKVNGQWRLIAALKYEGKTDDFFVPVGFLTDFASVPRLLQGIVPKMGTHDRTTARPSFTITYTGGPQWLRRRKAKGR